MSGNRVSVSVLGPLRARLSPAPGSGQPGEPAPDLELGGPRQRAVLSLLLVARGDVVSVDRLIDDLWLGEPPPSAIGALQAYVANLRRTLEPGRPPRAPASVLVSVAPGYAIRLPDDAVDAWRFEALLRRAAPRDERHRTAGTGTAGLAAAEDRKLLEESLGLWHGRAYAEFADEPWAAAEAARLEELRLVARERLAGALLAGGAAAEAVPQAEVLTREHPLREEGWRLLALALYAAGRQGESLAALRRARDVLADELGLDPGRALLELEAAVLGQRVELPTVPRLAEPAAEPAVEPAVEPLESAVPPDSFVGRQAELAAAHQTAAAARRGTLQLLLVSGEPGMGKSALLDQIAGGLGRAGWRTALGRCPEVEGAPPAWPWAQVLRVLTAPAQEAGQHPQAGPHLAPELLDELAPLLHDRAGAAGDVTRGRFRLHRAVAGALTGLGGPVLVVLDDLHRADQETLAMLRSVCDLLGPERSGPGVLLVAAFRPGEVDDRLEEAFAGLARHSPVRLRLAGLDPGEAAAFVTQVCGLTPDGGTLAALSERTGGNPFYLRESARLLASEGELVATSEVPEGVRDILRRRIARLPELAVAVLRMAAVAGRDVDIDVLVEAAEVDEDAVIEALEAGVLAGLLTEPGPGQVRFAHVLVQETLLGDLPRLRRARWHARIAAALERCRPGEFAALAHHYVGAGSSATALRAVDACVTAAELAASRYAHATAATLYRQALDCLGRVPASTRPAESRGGDDERLRLYCALVPALLLGGNALMANAALAEALDLAERAGDDDGAVAVLRSFDIAQPWLTRDYAAFDERKVRLLRRLLTGARLDAAARCQLLCVLVREEGPNDLLAVRPEALQAAELARDLGDPVLLVNALSALAGTVITEYEPDLRRQIAREMLAVATRHDRPAGLILARHSLLLVACVEADLPAVRQHLDQIELLATRYQLVQMMDSAVNIRAMLAHVAGQLAQAREAYLRAAESMRLHGSLNSAALAGAGLFTLALTSGRAGELEPWLRPAYQEIGPPLADSMALIMLANGDRDGALAAYRQGGHPRRDFFHLMMLAIRGLATVALERVEDAEQIREQLLPWAGMTAGAGTAAFVTGPVDQVLGDLAILLGRRDEAREHYRRSLELSTRLEAPLWAAAATAALSRL